MPELGGAYPKPAVFKHNDEKEEKKTLEKVKNVIAYFCIRYYNYKRQRQNINFI